MKTIFVMYEGVQLTTFASIFVAKNAISSQIKGESSKMSSLDGIIWIEEGFSVVSLSVSDYHFDWIETATAHTMSVTDVDLRGIDSEEDWLANGDEITVVTPLGLVAGGIYIEGDGPYEFPAYGDNPATENAVEGFLYDEPIYFHVWIAADQAEYLARTEWHQNDVSEWRAGRTSRVILSVVDSNIPPIWRPLERVDGREGQRVEFSVVTYDPNADPVSVRLVEADLPEDIDFYRPSPDAGTLRWMPGYDHAGQYSALFEAYDGWDIEYLLVAIHIENFNRAPALANIDDFEITEGQPFAIVLELHSPEPDGDRVEFSSSELPYGATMEDNLFHWTPNYDQAGQYDITFRVTDFGQPPAYDEENVTLTVLDSNRPPAWIPIDPITSREGLRIQFLVRAFDRDDLLQRGEDNLSLSAGNLPDRALFEDRGAGIGLFNWQTNRLSSGEYHPYFVAFDGQYRDTLAVELIVLNANAPPRLANIESQQVMVGELLELPVTAVDNDPGDQAQLELIGENLPDGAEFEDLGEGEGMFTWQPDYDQRGVYPNVRFTAIDPDGMRDVDAVVFTALIVDEDAPVVSQFTPDRGGSVRSNVPAIGVNILDEQSEIEELIFVFDNQAIDDFEYDPNSGNLHYQPQEALSEGRHRYLVRAVDTYSNVAVAAVEFIVNSNAGVIQVDPLREFTQREMIAITGCAEPCLAVELWRSNSLLMQTEADERGNYRMDNVALIDGLNIFAVRGWDGAGNVAQPAWVQTCRDVDPPVIEFLSPGLYSASQTPLIEILVDDAGIGVSDGQGENERLGVEMTFDGDWINDFNFENDLVSYQVPDVLAEGEHLISISAVDRLGNAHEQPVIFRFLVDSEPPTAEHTWFSQEDVDSISNRKPPITIAVLDSRPSSQIDEESIYLALDDEPLDFGWDGDAGSLTYRFAEDDSLDLGTYELSIEVEDRAGNSFAASGRFCITDIQDIESPYVDNPFPPPNSVAGGGARAEEGGGVSADTIAFIIGDDDSGVDEETVWVMIIALNNPDDPRDNDTTIYEGEDLFLSPQGHARVPVRNRRDDFSRLTDNMPSEMPGLEEGLNEINIYGADEDGNEGGEQWGFFYDDTPPDQPQLDEPENQFVNSDELTVTGTTGGDEPEYEEDYENEAEVLIYLNDELAATIDHDWESEFSANLTLTEGENTIYAVVVDAGGNESDPSNSLELFFDLSEPEIDDFAAVGGPHLATGTPSFTATVNDQGSGIDDGNISLTIGESGGPTCLQVGFQVFSFNAEENLLTAQVSQDDELQDGEYTANLVVHDFAGNADSSDYEFDIDTAPPDPPVVVSFERYTGINRVSLTGEGEIGTVVVVFLDDEEIGEIPLTDAVEFEFEYTAQSLPDTSYITLIAVDAAETESDPTDPEMLVVDTDPPEFTHASPYHGEMVEAETLDEVTLFIDDPISGIDANEIEFSLRGDPFNFNVTGTDSGYWLTADVSEVEFNNDETVEVTASACDVSSPANLGQLSWEFITHFNQSPEVLLPDTSFNEDEQLTLDMHDYISDSDNSFDELELVEQILDNEEYANLIYDAEEGFLHLFAEPDWFGDLMLTVQATDPGEAAGADTAAIEVEPVNDPPSFHDVPEDASIFVGEEFAMQLTAEDIDPDDVLTFISNTELFDVGENGQILFTPSEEEQGLHVIEFYVFDQENAGDTTLFHLYITVENQPVELIGQIGDIEIDEDAESLLFVDLDDIFEDADEDTINFLIEYDSDGILIEIDLETNEATLNLDPDFNGEINVTITADDLKGSQCSTSTLVNVLPVNDPPRQVGLLPYYILTYEGDGEQIIARMDTVFIDVDEGEIVYDWDDTEHVDVEMDEELTLSVIPADGWTGVESFILTVEDGINPGERNPQRDAATLVEITIDVQPVNEPPQALIDDPYEIEMQEDQEPLVIQPPISEMFMDPDPGDQIEITWDDLDGPIELSFDQNEEYLVATIVEENFNGSFDYPITAGDWAGETVTVTLAFTVLAVNDQPEVIQAIADVEVDEDADPRLIEIVDLYDIFIDVDNDELIFTVEGAPALLNMDVDEDNILFFAAADNFNIPDGVEITVYADDGYDQQAGLFGRGEPRTIEDALRDAGPVRVLRTTPNPQERTDRDSAQERQLRSVDYLWKPTEVGSPGSTLFNRPRRDDAVSTSFILTINPVNDPPVVVNPISDIEIDEDSGVLEVANLNDVFEDPEGDELTFAIIEGIEELNLTIDEETGVLTLESALNYNGESEVTITADDGQDEIRFSTSVRLTDGLWQNGEANISSVQRLGGECRLQSADPSISRAIRRVGVADTERMPRRDLVVDDRFMVNIIPVNDPPGWEDTPGDSIEYVVTDLISFELTAFDIDGDDLSITFDDRSGIPEAADFTDYADGTASFNWQTGYDDEGVYDPLFSVSDGSLSTEFGIRIIVSGTREQVINLSEGWNIASLNIEPAEEFWSEGENRGPDIRLMLEAFVNDNDEQLLFLIKDQSGDFCLPSWDYYGIDFWNTQHGYWIKMDADWDAGWYGSPILAYAPIDVAAGWNIIPYYPTYDLDASEESDFYVLSPIIEHVLVAKDAAGNFMYPVNNFSNMSPWTPGQGYQLHVDENVTLEYPEPLDEAGVLLRADMTGGRWAAPVTTGENMSVLICSLADHYSSDGDQIAAFSRSSGRLVGVGIVSEGSCGLAVWGDDPYTEEKDGLSEGDEFYLVLWNAGSGKELNLTPMTWHIGSGLNYTADELIVLGAVTEIPIPEDFSLFRNYPNPFNPSTQIGFALPRESDVTLSVLDISGRLLEVIVSGTLPAGHHTATWSADNMPTGVYIFTLETEGVKLVTKGVLIR